MDNQRRPFKVRISTLTPARAQLVNVTKRKDRAAELKAQQNQKATLLQTKWRGNRIKADFDALKTQPPTDIWRGPVELGKFRATHTVVVQERYLAGRGKGLVTYVASENRGQSLGPSMTLTLIRESVLSMSAIEGERTAKQLEINDANKLFIDKSKTLSAGMVAVAAEEIADDNDEVKLESYRQVPFSDMNRVQFCVDGAVGLPINCTASRVSGQLMLPNRQRLGPLLSSLCDPDSSMCCPKFDLFMTWRGNQIIHIYLF